MPIRLLLVVNSQWSEHSPRVENERAARASWQAHKWNNAPPYEAPTARLRWQQDGWQQSLPDWSF